MESLRQKARPKHQMLTLKCYPRYQKNAAEIKPNSSELSYLLYYVNTRRSKLQKVGMFLERKTGKDVSWGRTGDVHVTLQIATALIEKCPRELPLYSVYILQILQSALSSNDIGLVEESVATFSAFCSSYDSITVSTDTEHLKQFDEVIKLYSEFASGRLTRQNRGQQISVSIAIRLRSAGLQALKSLVSSEAFAMDNGRTIGVIMPSILQNLQADRPHYLRVLREKESAKEQSEKDPVVRRRASMSISKHPDLPVEPTEDAAFGSTADADARANEEVGVLALQALRQIFSANNRGQLRAAAAAALHFVASHSTELSSSADLSNGTSNIASTWYTGLFDMVCRWTPVQDRYIIIVTVMEALVKSPIIEKDLGNQLVLARIISWLLRSDINCIGLSVMDVLIGLIQHILLLLQLGGPASNVMPHGQQSIVFDNPFNLGASGDSRPEPTRSTSFSAPVVVEVVQKPSSPRMDLIERIQRCIGDLASHIYYSEQVGDMISALLLRLKPSPTSAVTNPTSAVEDPSAAAEAIADSVNLQDNPHTDEYFSFETARCLALESVKEIMVTANARRKAGDAPSGRNRVRVDVWEGTQWLLRDPDGKVRKAYVDALCTWLQLELDKKDLRLIEETKKPRSKVVQSDGQGLAKRAISNASQKSKARTSACSAFLQLLHLAIYENALQFSLSEPDILLLHALMTRLVQKMGVNSVRSGLPMVFRLQEAAQEQTSAAGRVAISSLCFGYFWALSETFDFDGTGPGRQIHKEISQRWNRGCWLKSIHVPPLTIEQINVPTDSSPASIGISDGTDTTSLQPFEARQAIVDYIADAYANSFISPPTSPPASPNRTMSMPVIPAGSTSVNFEQQKVKNAESALPGKVKEEMLTAWTRESCISAVEHERKKTTSLSGSKTGSQTGSRKYLAATAANGSSPAHPLLDAQDARQSPSQIVGQETASPIAIPGSLEPSPRSPLSSSGRAVVRVEDLKRVLAGQPAHRTFLASAIGGDASVDDTGSESMVTAPSTSGSESESVVPTRSLSGAGVTAGGAAASRRSSTPNRGDARSSGPSTPPNFSRPVLSSARRSSEQVHAPDDTPTPANKNNTHTTEANDSDVPPVPLLPANLRQPPLGSPFAASVEQRLDTVAGEEQTASTTDTHAKKSSSRARDGFGVAFPYSRWERTGERKVDMQSVLARIGATGPAESNVGGVGATPKQRTVTGMVAPPY